MFNQQINETWGGRSQACHPAKFSGFAKVSLFFGPRPGIRIKNKRKIEFESSGSSGPFFLYTFLFKTIRNFFIFFRF